MKKSETLVVGVAVKHSKRPEWGVGEVIGRDDLYCHVRFGDGERRFEIERSATLLEPTNETPPRARPSKKPPTSGSAPCSVCEKPLRKAIYKESKAWKSCPSCSQANGSEHATTRP